jgi:hypothetical protein
VPTHREEPWERDAAAARARANIRAGDREDAGGGVSGRREAPRPTWSAGATERFGLKPEPPVVRPRRPTRSRSYRTPRPRPVSGWSVPARAVGVACLIGVLAAIAGNRLPGGQFPVVSAPGGGPASTVGPSTGSVPGAYIAVPGAWHTRSVRVLHPPPGSPAYVQQRYRTIHYVGVAPTP